MYGYAYRTYMCMELCIVAIESTVFHLVRDYIFNVYAIRARMHLGCVSHLSPYPLFRSCNANGIFQNGVFRVFNYIA